jgi:hypothetical protein
LVDTFIVSIPRILKKDYLHEDKRIEELNEEEYDKKNVCPRLNPCAKVAEEEDGSNDPSAKETGYVPSQ